MLTRATNTEIATRWRDAVMSPHAEWKTSPNKAGYVEGMSKGFMVSCCELDRRAYLKPIEPMGDVAAREKIASDLAFELGVAVPPVVLARRSDLEVLLGGKEECVMLSLVMYQTQHS